MKSYDQKRSPLKSTQWTKRGFTIPKDKDGAFRAVNRLDGRNVTSRKAQEELA
jgi:hypothetical protein